MTDMVTGNFGITDQRLALQWVYSNIDRFGGQRTNVSITVSLQYYMKKYKILDTIKTKTVNLYFVDFDVNKNENKNSNSNGRHYN